VKKFLVILAIIFTGNIFASNVQAEIKTYTGIGDYVLSEDVPPGDIKSKAKMYAEKNALEQAGVFVSGLTEVKNNVVSKDEIITIVGGILKIIDTKFEIIPLNDAAGIAKYRATVTAQIDTNLLDAAIKNWLNRDANEKANLVQQNKSQQQTIADLQKRIAELEKQAANVKTAQDRQNIQSNFAEIDKETLAAQKLEEGNKLFDKKNYQVAISRYNEAIKLNPNFFEAYYNRGVVYGISQNYIQAISDYTQAIKINPSFEVAYNNRGAAYKDLKNYSQAISDYTQAIKLNPNYANAYYNRGIAYDDLQKYEQAIADYTQAIKLNPKNSNLYQAYSNRGVAYAMLENYEKSISDFTQAIRLNPNGAELYYNRGLCYQVLGQNSKAEADFEKAKELGYNS